MHYNVVIVGSGLAGLYAALHLAESNMRVLLLSKQAPKDSSSAMAQGGVAAVLECDDDSFALHRDDTLAAGNYKNDIDAVETLVREGPEDVRRVMSLGVQFDRTPEGELDMTIEGGHSRRRVVHRADRTGREMMDKLLPHVRGQQNATLLEDATAFAAEKIPGGGFVVDALVGGQPQRFSCDFLLLASGGIGQVYRHTTNPAVCTGDGIRLAYELGAKLRNMRYVQFHPTAFAGGGDEVSRFLITEAVRGEGGLLLNAKHERFMHHYDPREELAPRDVVSKAIILESQRVGSTTFYLDIRHRGEDFLRQRFPGIAQTCLRHGVDITKDLIPVFPCQHYHMGGVEVDWHSRTSVPGLYAAGECAHTGLHGGNRLASNSLPEALVFGRRAAQDIVLSAKCLVLSEETFINHNTTQRSDAAPPQVERKLVQQTMQDTFFVFPNKAKLPAAAVQMRKLYEELSRETATPTRESAELRSLACVAMLILEELLQ
ncbi:MAG: FAD-dependent oxidoreductase [Oscillospiraceae bacterium]|nr:FAD-dependent oxidoreductase [Oscillospiraceae bacterium]